MHEDQVRVGELSYQIFRAPPGLFRDECWVGEFGLKIDDDESGVGNRKKATNAS
jgi:hypothetical protein